MILRALYLPTLLFFTPALPGGVISGFVLYMGNLKHRGSLCVCVFVCVQCVSVCSLCVQCVCVLSRSVTSDPLQPRGLYSPPGSSVHGDSPGKNTEVGCHSHLQRIFPTQGLNPGLLHCRQILFHLKYQGSPLDSICCCCC